MKFSKCASLKKKCLMIPINMTSVMVSFGTSTHTGMLMILHLISSSAGLHYSKTNIRLCFTGQIKVLH